MAEPDESSVLRLVVVFLRFHADMTQAEFGKASRVDQSDISKYEKGAKPPPEEALRRMARAADVDWPVVVHLRRAYGAILSVSTRQAATPDLQPPPLASLDAVLLAITPYLIGDQGIEPRRQSPEEARHEAEEIWAALECYPIPRRRQLIEQAPRASRSPALMARVCAASLQAAPHDSGEALELADLALSIAGRVPAHNGLRARAQGYGWATSATPAGSPMTMTEPTRRSSSPGTSGVLAPKPAPSSFRRGSCSASKLPYDLPGQEDPPRGGADPLLEAAKQEAATLELVRRVIAEIEQAKRSASTT
jgi:transcriptional regulator with XRE-family HTH domain